MQTPSEGYSFTVDGCRFEVRVDFPEGQADRHGVYFVPKYGQDPVFIGDATDEQHARSIATDWCDDSDEPRGSTPGCGYFSGNC